LSLYRSAFHGHISRWLFEQGGMDFSNTYAQRQQALRRAVRETWFCPVTDSMDIAQFLHVNELSGEQQRPPWRVLKDFGARRKIRDHCDKYNYKRVVLLEDFVGSGTQAAGPLIFAAQELGPSMQILFVPLIASEAGVDRLVKVARLQRTLTVEPLFVIPRAAQVHAIPVDEGGLPEHQLWRQFRRVVERTFPSVMNPAPPATKPLKQAFGFGKLGMLLVLYTNCPNNTLPLIWHSNESWQALFPRVSRS
jgi:hypothetical protein